MHPFPLLKQGNQGGDKTLQEGGQTLQVGQKLQESQTLQVVAETPGEPDTPGGAPGGPDTPGGAETLMRDSTSFTDLNTTKRGGREMLTIIKQCTYVRT